VKRFALLLVALLAGFVALAAPAAAHITVSSPGAEPGEEAVLTFHVPTESAKAATTKLAVQLPSATPFASVDVLAQPGWTFTVTDTKLSKPITNDDGDQITQAASEVEWTASSSASAIKPGEFGEFSILAGPLPSSDVAFGAVQTYSDGSVVRWNEEAAPGSTTEPEHPKPTLTIAEAAQPKTTSTSNTGPTVLAIVALVVAAAALGLAVVGRVRRTAS
jgi:uncharacterized protein YcnI